MLLCLESQPICKFNLARILKDHLKGDCGLFTGHSSTTDYQPSTSGLIQSMSVSVFDESQARSVEPAVIDAKENQSMWQKTDNMVCNYRHHYTHSSQAIALGLQLRYGQWRSGCFGRPVR